MAIFPAAPIQNQEFWVGEARYQWNGFAWDRLLPIDWSEVPKLRTDIDKLEKEEFAAPRDNQQIPNAGVANDLDMYLSPGSFPILGPAANKPESKDGNLLVLQLGTGASLGTDQGVQQVYWSWIEGSTAATIRQGDVWIRVGLGGVFTPWKRLNPDGEPGRRFVGTYGGALSQVMLVDKGINGPYSPGNHLPPATQAGVDDRDYLIVGSGAAGPFSDPNLPINNQDGTPLQLAPGDRLVAMSGKWVRFPAAGGGGSASITPGIIDNQALVWNALSGSWKPQQLNLSETFLANVSPKSPGPDDILTWNTAISRYEPQQSGAAMLIGYGQPIPANTLKLIATDADGDAMVIDVWGRSAAGTCFIQVAVARGPGTDSAHTVIFDLKFGVAPVITFKTAVVAGATAADPPQLQVLATSNLALLEIKGKIRRI